MNEESAVFITAQIFRCIFKYYLTFETSTCFLIEMLVPLAHIFLTTILNGTIFEF